MKKCPNTKCNNLHDKPGIYCSRKCSNSRTWSEQDKENKRKANKKYAANLSAEDRKEKFNNFKNVESYNKFKTTINEKYKNMSWDDLSQEYKKKLILEEQNGKCNSCGISDWNNKPITLQLEHKDGNNQNDAKENLECLCPNCHSQTKTFAGRNKVKKVSDEELIMACQESSSFRQALIKVGLSPRGANYERVKKLMLGSSSG